MNCLGESHGVSGERKNLERPSVGVTVFVETIASDDLRCGVGRRKDGGVGAFENDPRQPARFNKPGAEVLLAAALLL